ncbi:MAG: beta-lactamase family protein [Lentisphaeria bacterium]|nr:beta-lactamase family protein [Lentisphaeria bacterium]
MFKKLDDLLDSFLTYPVPWNDCIVCHKGEVIYRRFAGFTDAKKTMPVTGKEKCQIFSCSKLITCSAALQLWEKGAFQMEDELALYLPEYAQMKVKTPDGGVRDAENKITIRQLFAMTAGFNYDVTSKSMLRAYDATNGSCHTREVIRHLAQEPLEFEPGTRWQYSLAHDVLAAVVEVISGMSFNDYVTKNIFDVLGMKDSTFLLPASEFDSVVPLYQELPEGERLYSVKGPGYWWGNPYRLGPCYACGGAGCVSTVEDYNKLLQTLCSGEKILKRGTVDLMRTDQLSEQVRKECFGELLHSYGLGVRCPPRGSSRTDFGWGGAGGAYYAIDPDRELTVLYMQHVTGSSLSLLRPKILETVYEILGY